MADDTAGGNGQAPTQPATPAANGQAPTPPTSATSAPQTGQAPTATPDTYTPPSADDWKRIQQELAEARRDAGKYRDEIKKRDDANLSADQKRERDYADLQAKALEYEMRNQRLTLENHAHRMAGSLGISDITAALALVQVEHAADVAYEADGTPKNLADLLKQVIKDHPALAAQAPRPAAPSAGGATNPGRQAGNGQLTEELIRAMPMRDRMARIKEIEAWEQARRQQR